MPPTKKRKYLIVGAGPVGSAMALKLREKYPSSEVEIEIFDKRMAPGERYEMLFLGERTWNTFSTSLQESLIRTTDGNGPKAFYSPNTFHQFKNPFKMIKNDPHLIVSIFDLENALHEEIKHQNIVFHRGLKFVSNYTEKNAYMAMFEDINTHQHIVKKYDEIIFAIGLSDVLKQMHLEQPRFLHGLKTIAALYRVDNQHFDVTNHPTQITYLSLLNLAGVTIAPQYLSIFSTIPRNCILDQEKHAFKYLERAINAIPKPCRFLIKNIGNPITVKVLDANANLSPTLTYDSLHGHPIGDMLVTFPFVYGAETNFALSYCIPLLLNHLDQITRHPEKRLSYSEEYCSSLKKLILNHADFLRLMPFCDSINLGSKKFTSSSIFPIYHFPGWDALKEAKPIAKNDLVFPMIHKEKKYSF